MLYTRTHTANADVIGDQPTPAKISLSNHYVKFLRLRLTIPYKTAIFIVTLYLRLLMSTLITPEDTGSD